MIAAETGAPFVHIDVFLRDTHFPQSHKLPVLILIFA